jgi:hypothetical protein
VQYWVSYWEVIPGRSADASAKTSRQFTDINILITGLKPGAAHHGG